MDTYTNILRQYEEHGIIPLADIKMYAQWREGHHPRQCPYCHTMFSVNLAEDADHIIHCPVCCMELEYRKEPLDKS